MTRTRSQKGKGKGKARSKTVRKSKTPSNSPTKQTLSLKDRKVTVDETEEHCDPFADESSDDPFADESSGDEKVNIGHEMPEKALPDAPYETVFNIQAKIAVNKDDRKFLLKANRKVAMVHGKVITAGGYMIRLKDWPPSCIERLFNDNFRFHKKDTRDHGDMYVYEAGKLPYSTWSKGRIRACWKLLTTGKTHIVVVKKKGGKSASGHWPDYLELQHIIGKA